MTTFTFDGNDGDPLASSGITVTAGEFEIQNNKARPVGTKPAGDWLFSLDTPLLADGIHSFKVSRLAEASGNTGLIYRQLNANNYWWLAVDFVAADFIRLSLYKILNGGQSVGAQETVPKSTAIGVDYEVRLEVTGGTHRVYLDNVLEINLTSDIYLQSETGGGYRTTTDQFVTNDLVVDDGSNDTIDGGGSTGPGPVDILTADARLSPDERFAVLRDAGYTGSYNDMKHAFLLDAGYTGSLADMAAKYRRDGGAV